MDDDAPSRQGEINSGDAASTLSSSPVKTQQLLWVSTAPGVTAVNLATFYFAALITVSAYTYVNIAQRLVLGESFLAIPEDEMGSKTGEIGFYSELMIILMVPLWGVASDKVGRKPVYVAGLVVIALAFILMSYATSFGLLVLFRLVYAVGAAATAAMMGSVLADYVTYQHKGRASGFMGFFCGCGALLAALILIQLPEWLQGLGPVNSVHWSYIITAMVMLAAAVVLLFGMQNKTRVQQENVYANPMHLLRDGLKAAYKDPQLALAFVAGFVARGDSVVLITFLSLWVQDYYTQEYDYTEEEAASMAGMVTGIAQTFALIFSLVAGYIGSHFQSVTPVIIVASIATVGYAGMCFVADPGSALGIFWASIIGMGEIGVIVIAQSLAARRSPILMRGAIGGLVGMSGSFGILLCNLLGGYLYDHWSPVGPFLLFAIFNFILLVSAVGVLMYERKHGILDLQVEHARDEETYARLLQDGQQSEYQAAAILSAGAKAY